MKLIYKSVVFFTVLLAVAAVRVVPAVAQECNSTVKVQDSLQNPGAIQRAIENAQANPNDPIAPIVVCLEPGLHLVNGAVSINKQPFPNFILQGAGGRATIDILPNPGGQLPALVQIERGTITLQDLTIQSAWREKLALAAKTAIRIMPSGFADVTLRNVETNGLIWGVEAVGSSQSITMLTVLDSFIRGGSIGGGIRLTGRFSTVGIMNSRIWPTETSGSFHRAVFLEDVVVTGAVVIQNNRGGMLEGGVLRGAIGGAIRIRNSSGTIGIRDNTIAGPGADLAGIFIDQPRSGIILIGGTRLQGGARVPAGNTIQGFGQRGGGYLLNVDAIRIRWADLPPAQQPLIVISYNEITANGGCAVRIENPERGPSPPQVTGVANMIFANCVSPDCKSQFGSNDTTGNLCPSSAPFGKGLGGGFLRVADIQLALQPGPQARATVTITDGSGNPVKDAQVMGVWTLNSMTLGAVSGKTNALGMVQLDSGSFPGKAGDTIQFCVLQVSHPTLNMNSAANAKTCESLKLS